ncbi:hypothetical protein [Pseudomonas syringae]|uniref:hypothetical protein n=1 Tax=Pseudomonas syringae TaxID=317 RepID=UPI000B0E4F10|nr:hypothetical protein [Pseudomonas syringae]
MNLVERYLEGVVEPNDIGWYVEAWHAGLGGTGAAARVSGLFLRRVSGVVHNSISASINPQRPCRDS